MIDDNPVLLEQEVQPEVEAAPEPTKEQRDLNEIKEYNFKLARQQAEQERQARQASEQRAYELEQRLAQLEKASKNPSDSELDTEDLMEMRTYKKYHNQLMQKTEEGTREIQDLKKSVQHFQAVAAEASLASRFPDFKKIVNEKNLKALAETDPVMYKSIFATEDLAERGERAFKIMSKIVPVAEYSDYDERVAQNKLKPKAASSVAPQQPPSSTLSQYKEGERWKIDRYRLR